MTITEIFEKIPDPRIERRKLYSLSSVLGIALCATLCGATDFEEMEEYGNAKIGLMRQLFDLPNGIPSHDTFNRVFKLITPEAFGAVLTQYGAELVGSLSGHHICIDGKCMRGTGEKGKKGNHCQTIVSAWVSEAGAVIGQQSVEDKSNEITAVPKVLEALDLRGATVSLDAMGAQREIATQIANKGGYYLLAIKSNHPTLHKELIEHFDQMQADEQENKTTDCDHGRIEVRTCRVSNDLKTIYVANNWTDLKTIICVKSEVEFKNKDQRREETRYYISNRQFSAKEANQIARAHWGIENNLHWQLDVTFKEDNNQTTTPNAAENLNTLRKLALQIVQQDKKSNKSKKIKVKNAAWDDQFLIKLLKNANFYSN
ncbi:MAG TPA: ISAs1 family transposase [Chitinophagales bacterium]|nr:ISAs1 family transposase [Chitinophagales bacterium]